MIKAMNPADPAGYAKMLISALGSEIQKPLVEVFDAGTLYDPLASALFEAGIPVFRSVDRALRTLAKWVAHR